MHTRFLALIVLSLLLAGPFPFVGCNPSDSHDRQAHSENHPETAATAAKYHCPMHPSIVSDKPGSCPICGMDLVPIGQDDSSGKSGSPIPKSNVPGAAVISISQEKRQLLGLTLGTVENRHLTLEIRTSARIVADETRLWRVSTKVEGWVEKLFVSYTGEKVKKGEPLLTVYSPELVSAQAEYLSALRSHSRLTPGAAMADPSQSLLDSARRRLELWDISDAQIDQLARTGTIQKALTLFAPASGVVLEKNIAAGQKLMPGNPLMLIADLSVVWADADIYQSDLPFIHQGMGIEVSLPFWPGKTFSGKLIFISPTLDEQTRTLRARLEIPNPEGILRPGMFGDAHLLNDLGETLSIPVRAVMRGGQSNYAFRDLGDGHLVPVSIQIGGRSGDYFQLLSGLKEGDRVVTSANFLVDSESNLKAGMEAVAPGPAPNGEQVESGKEPVPFRDHVIPSREHVPSGGPPSPPPSTPMAPHQHSSTSAEALSVNPSVAQKVSVPLSGSPSVAEKVSVPLSGNPSVAQKVSVPLSGNPSVAEKVSVPLSVNPSVAQKVSVPLSVNPSVAQKVSVPLSGSPSVAEKVPGPSPSRFANAPSVDDISIARNLFKADLSAYLRLQAALAADDLGQARAAAAELLKAGVSEAAPITDATSLEAARSPFSTVSEQFIATAQKLGNPSERTLYLFACPMADGNRGARWLQETQLNPASQPGSTSQPGSPASAPAARNPYFGSAMLECGESSGVFNPGEKP